MATNRDTIPPAAAPVSAGVATATTTTTASGARDIPHDRDLPRDSADRSPEQIEREIEATRREMSETIDAIQRRLSPDYLMDQAMAYLRTGPGTFANNLGKTMRDNPVPVALVGIGVAWLAMGGGGRLPAYLRHDERRARAVAHWRRRHRPCRPRARDWSGTASRGPGLGQKLSGVGHRAGEIMSNASERVRQMASDVRELAAEWSESASSTVSSAGAGARHYGSSVRDQAQHLGSSIHEQASHVGTVVRDQTTRVQNTFSHLMREQPLVVGAVGLAIGAMLGALFPSTRREDELMGQTRDRLLDQAAEAGQQALHQAGDIAKQSVRAATDTIKQEASERNWTQSDGANETGTGSDTLSTADRERGKTS